MNNENQETLLDIESRLLEIESKVSLMESYLFHAKNDINYISNAIRSASGMIGMIAILYFIFLLLEKYTNIF